MPAILSEATEWAMNVFGPYKREPRTAESVCAPLSTINNRAVWLRAKTELYESPAGSAQIGSAVLPSGLLPVLPSGLDPIAAGSVFSQLVALDHNLMAVDTKYSGGDGTTHVGGKAIVGGTLTVFAGKLWTQLTTIVQMLSNFSGRIAAMESTRQQDHDALLVIQARFDALGGKGEPNGVAALDGNRAVVWNQAPKVVATTVVETGDHLVPSNDAASLVIVNRRFFLPDISNGAKFLWIDHRSLGSGRPTEITVSRMRRYMATNGMESDQPVVFLNVDGSVAFTVVLLANQDATVRAAVTDVVMLGMWTLTEYTNAVVL